MVGIYADEAITGTKTVKRDGFLKMIDDCMAGMVDVILTKKNLLPYSVKRVTIIMLIVQYSSDGSLQTDIHEGGEKKHETFI